MKSPWFPIWVMFQSYSNIINLPYLSTRLRADGFVSSCRTAYLIFRVFNGAQHFRIYNVVIWLYRVWPLMVVPGHCLDASYEFLHPYFHWAHNIKASFAYVWNLDDAMIAYHVKSRGKVQTKSSNHGGQQQQEANDRARKGFCGDENDNKARWSEANHPSMTAKRKSSTVLTRNKLLQLFLFIYIYKPFSQTVYYLKPVLLTHCTFS